MAVKVVVQAMNLKAGRDRMWNGAVLVSVAHTIDHRLVTTWRRENGSVFTQTWSRRTPVWVLR